MTWSINWDRYYNWDDTFDYVDRDVMVGGPAAQQMAASFELFWNHRRSVALTHLRDVNRRILSDRAPPVWPTRSPPTCYDTPSAPTWP